MMSPSNAMVLNGSSDDTTTSSNTNTNSNSNHTSPTSASSGASPTSVVVDREAGHGQPQAQSQSVAGARQGLQQRTSRSNGSNNGSGHYGYYDEEEKKRMRNPSYRRGGYATTSSSNGRSQRSGGLSTRHGARRHGATGAAGGSILSDINSLAIMFFSCLLVCTLVYVLVLRSFFTSDGVAGGRGYYDDAHMNRVNGHKKYYLDMYRKQKRSAPAPYVPPTDEKLQIWLSNEANPSQYHQRFLHANLPFEEQMHHRRFDFVDQRHMPPLPGGTGQPYGLDGDNAGVDLVEQSMTRIRHLNQERGERLPRKRSDFTLQTAAQKMPWEEEADRWEARFMKQNEGLTQPFQPEGAQTDGASDTDANANPNANPNAADAQDDPTLPSHDGPLVDYNKIPYTYPPFLSSPTDVPPGAYPPLEPLGELFRKWPQDDIDNPPLPYEEKLQRFDYQNPKQRAAALKFRQAELPFKVYNVPEVLAAKEKWTDEYLAQNFDFRSGMQHHHPHHNLGGHHNSQSRHRGNLKPSQGTCQQSRSNYFAFFTAKSWDVDYMGPPPTMDTDWSFALWAKHARYADRVGLAPDATHYYWQSGVPAEERYKQEEEWTFVSRDLPGFSDTKPTFFCFDPDKQKGIQCRFGERGVTAATHYDAGRNMVAMITGAKRYVLSPPKACSKLGIVNRRRHPSFRHSMLNFGHVNLLSDDLSEDYSDLLEGMSPLEKAWLQTARNSKAVDTVLKEGEVLYIPSHWFHYITSLQKSAQCNVRSGRDEVGTKEFGGWEDVEVCQGEDD